MTNYPKHNIQGPLTFQEYNRKVLGAILIYPSIKDIVVAILQAKLALSPTQ